MRKPTAFSSLLAICSTLAACGGSTDDEQDAKASPELAEIERICDLPAGSLSGTTPIPNMNEGMPKIACAVEEAQKRGLNVGFISNPVDPNAQAD